MALDKLHILPSSNTPEVILNPDGTMRISGRAIDESRTKFSEQLMSWIESYIAEPAEKTELVVALEYLNSFNAIFLASVLKKLSRVNEQKKQLVIKWYIEEDDDDLLERAQHISAAFSIPIEYIMTDHIQDINLS
ncbi:MAG TPA: SiaC family regulatory phosphoprotein [Bacteroidales bacterium]|nr:SiaC family regulatory phosphoprotein [Bacteroidales bacterium]